MFELLSWAVLLSPVVYFSFLFINRNPSSLTVETATPGQLHPLKVLLTWLIIKCSRRRKKESTCLILPTPSEIQLDEPRKDLPKTAADTVCIQGVDNKGNLLVVRVTTLHSKARVALHLKLEDKVYQLPEMPDTETENVSSSSAGWAVGGLRLEIAEPLRKWRLCFNGLLKDVTGGESSDGEESLRHVRFNFIWTACSTPFILREDSSPALLADSLAQESWNLLQWNKTGPLAWATRLADGVDQYGTILGQVHVDPRQREPHEAPVVLHLRGLRQRLVEEDPTRGLNRKVTVSAALASGDLFTLTCSSHSSGSSLSHATYGHVRLASDEVHCIDWCSWDVPNFFENPASLQKFVIRFKAGGADYTATLILTDPGKAGGFTLLSGRPWSLETRAELAQCHLDTPKGTRRGHGLVEISYRYTGAHVAPKARAPASIVEPVTSETSELVLDFSKRQCRSSVAVGGKGSSLAALAQLSQADFKVPAGFCLTVRALERQLESRPELKLAVQKLENARESLEEEYSKVVDLFASSPVCDSVVAEVQSALARLGAQPGDRWAVRSSAVGEDAEDTSAAGQNETLLGLRSEEDILHAVACCWGSLFTRRSVSYRREHGQPVLVGMGVAVQRMVAADTAGVVFTCDPLTGDPRCMLISANYGLGESVVSSSVEPDEILVERKAGGQFDVNFQTCGRKESKTVMKDDGGVCLERVDSSQVGVFCLSKENAIRLAQVALRIEEAFGSPRDIEWAFVKGELFLLQARPVTALFKWSDFELLHELDAPVLSDEDISTTANTGEVLPGATSVLSQTCSVRMQNLHVGQNVHGRAFPYYYSSFVNSTHHHVTLDVINVLHRVVDKEVQTQTLVRDFAICGHIVSDDRMLRVAKERHGLATHSVRLRHIWRAIIATWKNKESAAELLQLSTTFRMDLSDPSLQKSTKLLEHITKELPAIMKASLLHSNSSQVSVLSTVVAMSVLAENAEELKPEHFSDMGVLLGSASLDVVSAQVPVAINAIACDIRDGPNWEEFCSGTPEAAHEWLGQHRPSAQQKFKAFLEDHGCRVIREFDFRTVTWDMEPLRLIENLQVLVKQMEDSAGRKAPGRQGSQDPASIVARLRTPSKASTRKILSKLLPWCLRCVALRERTKASFVRVLHEFRLAFRRLGELMETEGRLPDKALVFYLTFWELHQLVQSPRPVLLMKANRRRRLWNQWDALSFPEIMHGLPAPIKVEDDSADSAEGAFVRGTPVTDGSITARACVVVTLHGEQGISQLQPGDILVTHSTDVGWSPYFPILGGVITELGGLISHGAVVAREYGLPCVIGAQGASRIFKTGDTIMLCGLTGVVKKV